MKQLYPIWCVYTLINKPEIIRPFHDLRIRIMDEETKILLRNIAHHLKWVIVLLFAILIMLIARSLA